MTLERPLSTLIVDDEQLARERLADMLAGVPAVCVIGEAANGAAAIRAIIDQRPQLVFLDVQMPGLDGFDVLRSTRGAHRFMTVFVTAFDQHAIRAFDVHAADYLLKPVSRPRLLESVRRVVELASGRSSPAADDRLDRVLSEVGRFPSRGITLPIRVEGGTRLVRAEDISWIEADGDVVLVHAADTTYRVRERLADLEHRLRDAQFVRVHRSAIVNVTTLRSIQPIAKGDYHLVLADGTRLRSSRQYRSAVQGLMK